MKKLIYILFLFLALVACESTPPDLLSKGEMEDILYDIHLAQNMDDAGVSYDEKCLREITMRKSIFDKYGVSQEQWDTSFNYYCRHTEQLYGIYENLSERLRHNVIEAGGEVDGNYASGGDTSNVWNRERAFILMQHPPYNLRTFNIETDSTYMPGDRLALSFRTQFIFQDGMRDLVCVFTMTLKNDSVISDVRHVSSSDQITTLNLEDSEDKGIKNVRIYFIPTRNFSDDLSTTLRLISVSDLRLILNHCDREQKDKDKARQDSIKSRNDSINKLETEHIENVREERIEPLEPLPAPLPERRVGNAPTLRHRPFQEKLKQ